MADFARDGPAGMLPGVVIGGFRQDCLWGSNSAGFGGRGAVCAIFADGGAGTVGVCSAAPVALFLLMPCVLLQPRGAGARKALRVRAAVGGVVGRLFPVSVSGGKGETAGLGAVLPGSVVSKGVRRCCGDSLRGGQNGLMTGFSVRCRKLFDC